MPDNENLNDRLIIMETKFEMFVETCTKGFERLEKKLDYLSENFVTKEVLEEKLKQRDTRIDQLDTKIEQLETDKKDNKHIKPLWAAFGVSIVAVIVAVIPLFLK